MSPTNLTERRTNSPTNRAKQFRYLLTSFIFSCGVVFAAWVMPTFVSRSNLEVYTLAAFWFGAFASALCYWYRDKLFLQREPDAEPADLIWERCKELGTPYAVYLRNFEFERRQNRFPRPFVIGQYSGSSRRVEVILAKLLAGWLPVLALADPEYPFSIPGVHRFRRRATPWPNFLEQLLSGSKLIVIYFTESSPGLEYEMRVVREFDMAEKVLVIVGKTTLLQSTEFQYVLYESSPDFEDRLTATLEFFVRSQEGHTLPNQLNPVIPRRILQSIVFVVSLVIAFVIFGKPPLMDPMYWKWNQSMSGIRKTQERSREAPEELKKTAERRRKFEQDLYNSSRSEWQERQYTGRWTHDFIQGPRSVQRTRSRELVSRIPKVPRIRKSKTERPRHLRQVTTAK